MPGCTQVFSRRQYEQCFHTCFLPRHQLRTKMPTGHLYHLSEFSNCKNKVNQIRATCGVCGSVHNEMIYDAGTSASSADIIVTVASVSHRLDYFPAASLCGFTEWLYIYIYTAVESRLQCYFLRLHDILRFVTNVDVFTFNSRLLRDERNHVIATFATYCCSGRKLTRRLLAVHLGEISAHSYRVREELRHVH
jgi:hypothetical protein